MKRVAVLAAAVTVLSGCAALSRGGPDESERRLAQGLEALDHGNYAESFEHLSWVAARHPNDVLGQRALLALGAADLDPRNPGRRIGIGAELVGRYLAYSDTPEWVRPVAQTLYLLGQELGAAEERVAAAVEDKERAEARADLPSYSGTPVPARIRALTEERDRLKGRVAQLEKELAEKKQELERLRKTLRP